LMTAQTARPSSGQAETSGSALDEERLALIDGLVEEAIRNRELPGAVVVAGRGSRVLYRKAFGLRATSPATEPMTLDTIFDVASLTKVVATTTAVMKLVEDGKLRLNDRVSAHIPEFGRYGKENITIRHLLTHYSGLRPDLDLRVEFEGGAPEAIRLATEEVPVAAPGERFIYSDINFFLLGHIVEKITGKSLDLYLRETVFLPLGMRHTMFLPPASLRPRIAPTESCAPKAWPCGTPGSTMLRGVVHDPTARRMDGIAGHAGLFSTGDDLAIFARMLLAGGTWRGTRVLSPLTIAKMTRPASPPGLPVRGLGWDIDTSYSSPRGEFLPVGSYGHTGFTGTSLWIDPVTQTFVIILSNRVHPDGKGNVTPLRARIASVIASGITDVTVPPDVVMTGRDYGPGDPAPAPAPENPVLTGIDVLRAENFARLRGRRVGLVTNHTGRASDGTPTIDLLFGRNDFTLVALFSPEHGIRGILDEAVPSSVDEKTGLPIHSLYGETRRPTDAMLAGIDTIVIDLQDIGARFYTYATTLAYVMEEAAKRKIKVFVLDRPNPIGGWQIEGPTLDESARGFTGYFAAMPTRHGMTLGEIARLYNAEAKIGADLEVVAMKNWERDDWFDDTGLEWINPSPNMRNLIQATLYPGIGSIEFGNISVGRGTDTPFEQIGAPWVDGRQLAAYLNSRRIPGVRMYPVSFTPTSSRYAGERCEGVFFVVTDREALRPVRLGLEVAAALFKLFPGQFQPGRTAVLFGSASDLAAVAAGADPAEIAARWSIAESRWRTLRAPYLLYR
ncbi:MAG TPA: exo-beta-N-acetylmuramidase NamZ domain-containing protein, partial [Vicinamibacterales bacterium]